MSDLSQNFETLERENQDLRDLFAYIRNKPENEAFELYRRLRMSVDPFKTLQQFRDAEALLLLPSHGTHGITDNFMNEVDWTSVAGDGIVSNLI